MLAHVDVDVLFDLLWCDSMWYEVQWREVFDGIQGEVYWDGA